MEKPMTESEKKEWEKEKQRKKQEYFASRNKNQGGANSSKFYGKRK
jgi:ATP-dependent RNA helicase RhlE